ncbi:MAG: HIT domain-containing protein, partial [Patescibacteria group bacterium]
CHARYTMLIYNQGQPSGASIYHPHAQLFSSNIVPDRILLELDGAKKYFDQRQRCVFCQLLLQEKEAEIRVICESDQFIAFTFYAARSPFEIWVLPKEHGASFASITPAQIKNLATALGHVFGLLDQTLDQPALNFFIHDRPTNSDQFDSYHWHIEIFPRLSLYGGYELGGGTIIDIMSPEDAAKYLRPTARPQ